MTNTIDLDKLREAIAFYERYHFKGSRPEWDIVLDAARTLLPKTKEVTCWQVEFTEGDNDEFLSVLRFVDEVVARDRAEILTETGAKHVRVTGPHKHVVGV